MGLGKEDGEWSQVTRKRGRKQPTTEQPKASNDQSLLTGIRPNPNPELTVEEIRKYHDLVTQEWQESACWKALQQLLQTCRETPGRPTVDTAICLGPGPFDPANGSSLTRRTAHMQTAAFGSIVSNLESCHGRSIRRVIQEPGFTQIDKQFCADLGFEVVDTPGAFSMVGPDALVFGIHMELPTYSQTLSTLPGIFIGAGLDEWEKLMNTSSDLPGLERIREMDGSYDKYPFPDLHYMFYGTTVYWKRAATQQEM